MSKTFIKYSVVGVLLLGSNLIYSKAEKFRAMWREDPSTTMVIGWNQVSGDFPVMLIDVIDHGTNADDYSTIVEPTNKNQGKGMNSHFVRLRNLHPNTVYYFIIHDSEGISRRYSFKTLPNNANERLSIIAGGDSRNNIEPRRDANYLVSRLRPHCVLFGGDMTGGDSDMEWQKWLEDWQLTIPKDGRITPIIVARGNHENGNQSLIDIFDVKSRELYYSLSLGGNLIRVYTLNSMIPSGGVQTSWLTRDLKANSHSIWKFAQYHQTMRPHTSKKPDQNEQYLNWAELFFRHNVNLVVESDAHCVKSTWPLRPSMGANSDNGFVRDDSKGTVYVGEGCWGAPLRPNDNEKSWTRNSGSFNQFKWIFVDNNKIEIRTVKTDGARRIASVPPNNIFKIPANLNIWNPSNGKVVTIFKDSAIGPDKYPKVRHEEPSIIAANPTPPPPRRMPPMEIVDFQVNLNEQDIEVAWQTQFERSGTDFEVERSVDGGQTFQSITIMRGKGEETSDYSYVDYGIGKSNPGTFINYRLKIIAPNGKPGINTPRGKGKKMPGTPRPKITDEVSKITPDAGGNLNIKYRLAKSCDVTIVLLNPKLELVKRASFSGQAAGAHSQRMNIRDVKTGKYQLVVKAGRDVVKRYRVSF